MNRFFRVLLVVFLLSAGFSSAATAEKLNLLVITVDDMSADSIGAFGCKLADTTPNIDRLAKQGLSFAHAHVQVGNCMPSRNVMWSGRYPHNNGVEGFYQVKNSGYPVLVTAPASNHPRSPFSMASATVCKALIRACNLQFASRIVHGA